MNGGSAINEFIVSRTPTSATAVIAAGGNSGSESDVSDVPSCLRSDTPFLVELKINNYYMLMG